MGKGQPSLGVGLFNLRLKAKPSGLPDSNVIFFVATKKTKQKKAWRCAGHVLFGDCWWQISVAGTFSCLHIPSYPRGPCGPLYLWLLLLFVCYVFCCKTPPSGRPSSTGPDSLALPYLRGYESWQRRYPPPGERPFLHPFCGRLDKKDGVWRDATRRLCFLLL